MSQDKQKTAVVVGGGLVGFTEACYLARDGFHVDVFEKYPDPRNRKPECFRSINLTLSKRGEGPLQEIGLLESVHVDSVPAYGRVAWGGKGAGEVLGRVDYGEKGESIQSVSRFGMNLTLLNAADRLENVTIHFGHELRLCDFEKGTATFAYTTEDGEVEDKMVTADLFIGADGAHSAMRAEMAKQKKLDYIDFKYHEHYYLEMMIPASADGQAQLPKNRLNVWPKDSFVLICLPNPDNSFSGTLVMPKHKFDQMLESEESMATFWREELGKVYGLVGEANLIQQFRPGKPNARTPCRLVSFKCEPYHASSESPDGIKFVLLGDAAHAMVPFYGQGMNTGFEDVQIFHQILNKHNFNINDAIQEFSVTRCKDGQAMSDFSYDHYEKLCSKVKKKNYNIRRNIDSFLHKFLNDQWVPEYTLVAFSHKPQSQCREIVRNQDKILNYFFYLLVVVLALPLILVLLMVTTA